MSRKRGRIRNVACPDSESWPTSSGPWPTRNSTSPLTGPSPPCSRVRCTCASWLSRSRVDGVISRPRVDGWRERSRRPDVVVAPKLVLPANAIRQGTVAPNCARSRPRSSGGSSSSSMPLLSVANSRGSLAPSVTVSFTEATGCPLSSWIRIPRTWPSSVIRAVVVISDRARTRTGNASAPSAIEPLMNRARRRRGWERNSVTRRG